MLGAVARTPPLPGAAGRAQRVLCLAMPAPAAKRPSPLGKQPCVKPLCATASVMVRVGCGPKYRSKAIRWGAGASAAFPTPRACGSSSPVYLCPAPRTRARLCGLAQSLTGPTCPHCPKPGMGGPYHVPAASEQRLAVTCPCGLTAAHVR
jgi:hypothetical protein